MIIIYIEMHYMEVKISHCQRSIIIWLQCSCKMNKKEKNHSNQTIDRSIARNDMVLIEVDLLVERLLLP